MKTTTAWQLPYPEPPDHTRTWEHWQGLAERTDVCLTTINAKLVPLAWSPTITGLTLGNGTLTADACRAGNLVAVSIRVLAAATSPTTAWAAVNTVCPLPVAPRHTALGSILWVSAGVGYIGITAVYGTYIAAGQMQFSAHAAVGSNINTAGPGNRWGTAVWGASAEMVASLVYTAN